MLIFMRMIYTILGSFCSFLNGKGKADNLPQIWPRKIPGIPIIFQKISYFCFLAVDRSGPVTLFDCKFS